jgi:uncharacterized protein YdaU (DUF1376 family)
MAREAGYHGAKHWIDTELGYQPTPPADPKIERDRLADELARAADNFKNLTRARRNKVEEAGRTGRGGLVATDHAGAPVGVNFYKHHLGDYDAATAHLSWDEDQAYTRLLRLYYRTEKPIPDRHRRGMPTYARAHDAATSRRRGSAARILRAPRYGVAQQTGGRGDHRIPGNQQASEARKWGPRERQRRHRKRRKELFERCRERDGNGPVTRTATAITSTQEPEPRTPLPPSGAFARFWAAWPKSDRKAARGKCEQLWRRGGFDASAEQIVAHVEAMKSSIDWRKESGAFIPAPLVYLNQRRWEGADNRPAAPELRLAI